MATHFLGAITQLYLYANKIRLANSILGIFANTASLIVFSRPRMKKISMSIYIRVLLLFYIYVNLNSLRINLSNINDWPDFTENSEFTCKFFLYTLRLPISVSVWLEVVSTLDRFLTITYSIKYKFLQRRFRYFSQIIILLVIISQMIIYSPIIFYTKFVEKKSFKFCKRSGTNILNYIDLVNLVSLPFILMLIFSLVTIWGIRKSRRVSFPNSGNETSRLKARDIKFGITLICLNLIFLILSAPLRILNIFKFIRSFLSDPFYTTLFIYITDIAVELQFSSWFFIQLAVNNFFRGEFFNLCKSLVNPLIRRFRLVCLTSSDS